MKIIASKAALFDPGDGGHNFLLTFTEFHGAIIQKIELFLHPSWSLNFYHKRIYLAETI
jgi:hypothetical protein